MNVQNMQQYDLSIKGNEFWKKNLCKKGAQLQKYVPCSKMPLALQLYVVVINKNIVFQTLSLHFKKLFE